MAEERRFGLVYALQFVFIEPEETSTPESTLIPAGAVEGELGLASWPVFVTRGERTALDVISRYGGAKQTAAMPRSSIAAPELGAMKIPMTTVTARQSRGMEMTSTSRPKPTTRKRKREKDEVESDEMLPVAKSQSRLEDCKTKSESWSTRHGQLCLRK